MLQWVRNLHTSYLHTPVGLYFAVSCTTTTKCSLTFCTASQINWNPSYCLFYYLLVIYATGCCDGLDCKISHSARSSDTLLVQLFYPRVTFIYLLTYFFIYLSTYFCEILPNNNDFTLFFIELDLPCMHTFFWVKSSFHVIIWILF